jgi:hypothetical protein
MSNISKKKQLELHLNKTLPDIIKKIKGGDSSVEDEFASLLLPYISLLLIKHNKVIECIQSEAGWVIMKLLNKIQNIDLNRPILGYIVNCTNNHCIDLLRKQNRKRYKVDKQFLKEKYKKETFIDLSVKDYINENFDLDLSSIIELRYIDNRTVREVADITGQTISSIREKIKKIEEVVYND